MGKPNKLHTNNVAEFKNKIFINFCKENGSEQVFSKSYTPKSHGASHKQIKNYVFNNNMANTINNDIKYKDLYLLEKDDKLLV